MDNLLARNEAPLTTEEWEAVDQAIVQAARRQLVARRFIDLYGPVGSGIQDTNFDTYSGTDSARIDAVGREEARPVERIERIHENIPVIYKDFILFWRDLETSRRLGTMIDVAPAAAAASYVAQKEDDFIFNGAAEVRVEGIMNASGRNIVPAGNWDQTGSAFDDIVAGIRKLVDSGFTGPFAIAFSPNRFAQLHRVYANTAVLEIDQIRELASAGVYQTPAIADYGVLISTGVQNLDLYVAQDMITGYLGPENLNHPFRVLESLVPRIKKPGAVCTFEPAKRTSRTAGRRRGRPRSTEGQ